MWKVLVNNEGVIDCIGTYDMIEKAIKKYQLYKQEKEDYGTRPELD